MPASAVTPQAAAGADPDRKASYREVFAVRPFRALFVAHVASRLGDDVAAVALTVLVYQRTGSSLLAALTFTLTFLPYVIVGGLFSSIVDRLPARAALVGSHLASAALVAVMAIPGLPVAALLTLLFLVGLLGPVFTGVRAAMLPDLLPAGPPYVLGRALFRIVSQSTQVVGGAVGGLLIAVISARGALVVDAASFAVSGLLVSAGTVARRAPATALADSVIADSIAGLRAVLRHRRVRALLLITWLVPAFASAPEALATPYVLSLGLPVGFVGVYFVAMPIGTVVADVLGGRFLGGRAQRRILFPGACICLLPLLLFAFHPPFWVVLALLLVTGAGFVHGLGVDRLVVQLAPAHLRGRVLAIESSGLMTVQAVGFAVWGGLGELLAPRWVVAIAGAGGLIVVAALARGLRAAR